MAHIARCIADSGNEYISSPSSPAPPLDALTPPAVLSERPYIWRMQQNDQQRRYQLFPKERKLPVLNSGKMVDVDKVQAMAVPPGNDNDKPSPVSGLKTRINHQNMARRRKFSVPDLGPMTTVQEVPMDSPTIPGRPAFHERSISAPGNSWLNQHLADPYIGPMGDEDDDFRAAIEEAFMSAASSAPIHTAQKPKGLPPLVIPESASRPIRAPPRRPYTHARSESTPIEASRFARMGDSPRNGSNLPQSTLASDMATPSSGNNSATVSTTPLSAPVPGSHRASPTPWERRCITPMPMERSATPQGDDGPRTVSASGHRRGASESSGIMDRGRPRKRSDGRNANESRRGKSLERKAFEELPEGWKPSDAVHQLSVVEAATLQRQAHGQAERFEILRAEDVDSLSKELRTLDERTEYLRRTYTSLRTGRRNLHSRICQYLRSPRVARFSYEAMLKQEEALAELDASIDDWVTKLEKAENRRTRVRQKLLEHVAAAAILPVAGGANVASESLQQAIGLQLSGVRDISTPPRSPTKPTFPSPTRAANSPSPQRVVAQVPSTIIEQPIVEETTAEAKDDRATSTTELKRADVESIKVYAGDDVYVLLADVEKELSKMSLPSSEQVPANIPEAKRTELHRKRSQELLSGMGESPITAPLARKEPKDLNGPTPLSPPAPTPPMKDDPADSNLLLSKAVFKPQD